MSESRPIWQSKTVWANVISAASFVIAKRFGVEIDADTQAAVLLVVNLVMRLVTDGRVTVLGAK